MKAIFLAEVVKATGGVWLVPPPVGAGEYEIRGVSTDSRTVAAGMLFVALLGEKFDGHQFLAEAQARGASALLIAQNKRQLISFAPGRESIPVIMVSDTLKALGDLSAWYRGRFAVPVVAVTGSVGKTTTKEMIAKVLEIKYRVHRSPGNFNNQVGIPLALLELKSEHQVSVLELGMSKAGEIARLAEITRPEVGVITNVAPTHLETMQSLTRIAQAKFELLDGMAETKSAVLNIDDLFLQDRAKREKRPVITYGIKNRATVWVNDLVADEDGCFSFWVNGQERVNLPVAGLGNVYNALAAFGVAGRFGVTLREAARALEEYQPVKMRLEVFKVGGLRIIDDSYNANPYSSECALRTLGSMRSGGRKIAVLADMLELGAESRRYHYEVGQVAAKIGLDMLVAIGPLAEQYLAGAAAAGCEVRKLIHFGTNQVALKFLLEQLRPGDTVLFKGSRGRQIDQIVNDLKVSLSAAQGG